MFCEMRGGSVWDMSSACIQGGIPRPLGANVLMEPHSPAPAWQLHFPKQEPADEERNDSGINSGSDFHSSPGSEHSQDFNHSAQYLQPTNIQHGQPPPYYPNPMHMVQNPIATNNMMTHLGFNPLSPPASEPMISPKNNNQVQETAEKTNDTTLTPCTSPHNPNQMVTPKMEIDDPLRRLQLTLEKNGLLPPSAVSPKPSEHGSMDDGDKSDQEMDEYDEQGLRIPKMNSHGKVKTFKCKQCDFVAITKLNFWEHSKAHIKADKLLTCPKCPFVTEYKHHLEYHLRNHFGSKPFKCDKCSYSCVNKSMLNSHMKSHSNIYQYRCSNCSYATKYCHSLKLHLRKYNHKPAMVLNPDGTPNPLPIIDVYGTRRGPKQKNKSDDLDTTPQPMQNPFAQFLLNTPPQMQLPFPYPFLGGFTNPLQNPLLFQNLNQLAQERGFGFHQKEEENQEERDSPSPISNPQSPQSPCKKEEGVLDLSKPEQQSSKSRRKGRAFKLSRSEETEQDSSDEEEESTTMFDNVEVVDGQEKGASSSEEKEDSKEIVNNNNNGNYNCQYCNIAFGDVVLYTMHMGYHGYKDPFTCNMCGEQCSDKVTFFLHIARTSHS